jgi:hypothetical protein
MGDDYDAGRLASCEAGRGISSQRPDGQCYDLDE